MNFLTIEPEVSGFLSAFFRKYSPGKRLPVFWAIHVDGRAGRDDMGLTPAGVVVIPRRVLDVLLGFRIGRAVLAQYVPTEPASEQLRTATPRPSRRSPRAPDGTMRPSRSGPGPS